MIKAGCFLFAIMFAVPAKAAGAPEADYKAIAAEYYSHFQQPGFTIDDLLSFYDGDIDFRDPTFEISIRGENDFRKLYSEIGTDKTGYRDIKWALSDIIVDGDRVVISGRWSGRFQDCPFDVEFITLWRMKGRLIAYQRDFFASGAFDRQIQWADGKANCASAAD